MSDSYQPIYDAVRRQISACDVGEVLRQSLDVSNLHESIRSTVSESLNEVRNEILRPCVLFRPSICIDGNQWCVLYGNNLQDGVAGFGDSVAEAMAAFDRAWFEKLQKGGGA